MARKNENKDALEMSQELPTEETPVDELEVRDTEGQTQEEAAGEKSEPSEGGGNEGEANAMYSPGAETLNPAYVTRNQDDEAAGDQ